MTTVAHLIKESMMKWITRERPKIDRIACPWLITRFI
ncbi:chromate resistance protein ChrB domain-containing protein, partial [Acinetobacter baumannii]